MKTKKEKFLSKRFSISETTITKGLEFLNVHAAHAIVGGAKNVDTIDVNGSKGGNKVLNAYYEGLRDMLRHLLGPNCDIRFDYEHNGMSLYWKAKSHATSQYIIPITFEIENVKVCAKSQGFKEAE